MLLTGCEKNTSVAPDATADDGESPVATPLLYTLMRQNAAQVQSFEVAPTSKATQLTTAYGNSILLKGSTFTRYDGSALSSSPIKIQVEEVSDRAGTLFAMLPTVTVDWEGGNLLESAGMLRIKAFQDTKPLELARGETIQLLTRNPSALSTPASMQLFTSYVGPAEDFGWRSVPNDSVTSIRPNPTNTGFHVTLSSRAFNSASWLNCDRLVPGASLPVQIQVTPQKRTEGDFTHVFIAYKNLNSLTYTPYMSDQGLATISVADGARVTAIVVRITKDHTCYYGEQTATVTTPFTFTPKLSALPAAEIITRIRRATQ